MLFRVMQTVGRKSLSLKQAWTVFSANCSQEIKESPIEMATGLDRKELLARLAGEDRYEEKVFVLENYGTFEKPNLVPANTAIRMLGCSCDPEGIEVYFSQYRLGIPKRCGCGYWIKLIEADPESFGSFKEEDKN